MTIVIAATTGWPDGSGGEFFAVIDPDTASEEKVRVDTRSGTTLTVTASGRGMDGTSAASHASGAVIHLCVTAFDLDEANATVAQWMLKATTAGQLPYISAANTVTMLAIGASARVLISSGSAPTWQALSGDVTVNASGVTAIGASKVTNTMMADDAIDSAEIADGAIDLAHMSANSVDSDQYVDGSVDAVHLAAAARPRWEISGFTQAIVSITTNTQLPRFGTGSANLNPAVVTEAGSIIGISASSPEARTAGSMTFEVYKNGVGTGLTCVIDDNPTQYAFATQDAGLSTFIAGDRLDVRATTSSFAAGATNNVLHAAIFCQVT